MSKHSRSGAGSGPFLHLALVAVGAVLTGGAWLFLVAAAIDFGVLARGGQTRAWLFTGAASLGAIVCLVLLLALVGRGLRVLGLVSDYKPRRVAARRRS